MTTVVPLLPHFTQLTGIQVNIQIKALTQSEASYIADASANHDVSMVWSLSQAISKNLLEPLDAFVGNAKLSDPGWWDASDVFPSARSFQTWSDKKQYAMAVTAEAQTLFVNKKLLGEKGLAVPRTMDELLRTAKALKTGSTAGIVMRSKASADASPWSAGGFVFSYGGDIMTPDGHLALTQPETVEAIEMYGRLLREAGPAGAVNYHNKECVADFMSGRAAMGCDTSNDIIDIAGNVISKDVVYGTLPSAAGRPAKPNMWHWTVGMNVNSRQKEAAWLFMQWVTSRPTCQLAAAIGLATPRASSWGSSAFQQRFGKQAAQAALSNLKAADGDLFKATWFHPKSQQILDPFGAAINEVVTGAKSAKAALSDASALIEKALA
jgi:multiple sugar transport system substrate-binding protein